MKKEYKNFRFIVFCGEHYNPLGIVRSLGEEKITPLIICFDHQRKITTASKYASAVIRVNSIEEGFELLVKNLVDPKQKKIIFTSDDRTTSYLDNHFDEIKDNFIFFNAGESGRISKYMEKQKIQNLAAACGFKIPKTVFLKNGDPIPDSIEFPIITKAISSLKGGWKNDVFICYSPEDIIENYKYIKSETISIQEYIKKDNELCLDGISYNHGNSVFISIASTYDYLIDKSYSHYMTVEDFTRNKFFDVVKQKLEKMFSLICFEGIFSVEFLIKENELIFLEINFRNSTWSYASTIAGMNLPVLWAHEMVANDPIEFVEKNRVQFDNFHAMVEIPDFKYRVLGRKINIFKWLKDFYHCKCKYFIGRKDIMPFFSFILGKIKYK